MAGTNSNFNAREVRDALQFAMKMGSPNKVWDKATFYFRQTRVWVDASGAVVENPRLDQDGNPFDPNLHAELTGRDPEVLDHVAVDFQLARPEELEVGSFRPTRVEITILDEDWEKIEEAIEVTLVGGDRYYISYEKPVTGLFDMDVHELVCYARDSRSKAPEVEA